MQRQGFCEKQARGNNDAVDFVFTKCKGPEDFKHGQARGPLSKSKSTGSESAESPVMDRRRSATDAVQVISVGFGESKKSRAYSETDAIPLPACISNSSLLEHIATSRFFHHYVSPNRTFYQLDLDFTSSIVDQANRRSMLAEIIIALGRRQSPRRLRDADTDERCVSQTSLSVTLLKRNQMKL